MNFIRSGAVVASSSFLTAVISFSGVIILANIIPSHELGTFFLFQATLGLLSIPADIGINGAIEKRISEGEHGPEVLGTALVTKIGILSLLSGGILLLWNSIQSYIGISAVHLLIVGLLLQEGSRVSVRTLRGETRVAQASVLQSLQKLIWVSGGILLALAGLGAIGLIYALLGSHLLIAVLGNLFQQTGMGKVSVKQFRSLISYARHNAITSVGGSIYNWMDTAMLGLFVGSSLIAAYEIAWRVSRIGLIVSRSVVVTTFPKISEWANKEEYESIANTVSDSLIPTFFLVVPSFFGALLLAPDILSVVYGSEYSVAAGAFIVLTLERIIRAANQVYSRCLHAINKPDLSARATIIAIAINLVLNWILIQEFGILGAAVATSISFAIKFVIEYRYLRRFVSIIVPKEDIGIIFGASISMAGCLYLFDNLINFDPLWSLITLLIAGIISYFTFLLLSQSMRRHIMMVSEQILRQVV